ncbi:auxin-responsive protein SAUR50 [Prunus yedoensis var. nudiflora]|uniref:Auxin-responsive protein SAUR50 n=1 Tax=Prunus yedoensis var. nudiflora TaxID=2094558 RepID=A0A314XW27_PRUYE|nr:auxin-responsive protein SAUR50 [Prunus yedoensis var. nudiflora]
MATAMKKVEKIRQIVRLKQLVMRWKLTSLRRRSILSYDDSGSFPSGSNRRIPAGFLAVYVGAERIRFVIQARGGLVLPCEVGFFKEILRFLERDESKFGRLGLEEFLKMVSEVGFDSCKELVSNAAANSSCHAFTPLLQKARG